MLRKCLKLFINISIVVAMVFAGSVGAYAAVYNPPWAHLINIPETDYFRTAEPWVDQMGYDGYAPQNLSSGSSYNYWKSDAIFSFCGHALADSSNGGATGGGLYFANNGWVLAEDKTNPSRANADPTYLIKNFGSADINDTLVVLLIGCGTGNTGPRYGNLLDWARSKGSDCAIGWTNNLNDKAASVFGMGFYRGARYNNYAIDNPLGYNSGQDTDLMQYAYNYMVQNAAALNYSVDTRLQSWVTKGQYGQCLQPARYGTP
ncbi:MAG: hypothetical protein ACYC56_05380 [Candidatus Aquicultor sp.]